MQAMQKAQVARELGVSAGRVSQYIAQGMPVLPDGKVDLDAARRWVGVNVDASRRVMHRAAKGNYSPEGAAPPGFSVLDNIESPTDRALVLAGLTCLYQQRADVAHIAAAAGASCKVAYAIANMAVGVMTERLLTLWRDAGVEYFMSRDPHFLDLECLAEPDWDAIAERAGEARDESSWREYQRTVFS